MNKTSDPFDPPSEDVEMPYKGHWFYVGIMISGSVTALFIIDLILYQLGYVFIHYTRERQAIADVVLAFMFNLSVFAFVRDRWLLNNQHTSTNSHPR